MKIAPQGVENASAVRAVASASLIGSALTMVLAAAPVQAQTQTQTAPSRVVPQTVAPVVVAPDGAVVLPESGVSVAPEGADTAFVRVGQIVVDGGDPALAAEVEAIVAPLEEQQASVADLYRAAARIEALYARTGQVLTRVTVPPQTLADGAEVRIRIVEGFIEAIDASGVPARVRKAVEARAQKLVGRKGLKLAQIERHVLLAARVPGVTLESIVTPGQEIGGAVLVLKAEWRPVSGMIGADNRLSDAYDKVNLDVQLVANGVLGVGEQVYGVVSTATDFALVEGGPMRRVAGTGVIVPIGADGLTLNLEYLHADTNPKAAPGVLPTNGKLDRAALRLRYPLTVTRSQAINISASFDMLAEEQTARGFGLTLSRDRLRFAALSLDWMQALQGGGTAGAELSFTQGLDVFKARDIADVRRSGVLLSRLGSEPDFSKVNGSLTLRRPLGSGVEATVTARGQVSLSGALPSSAQFSLDGGEGLSAFTLGALNADTGGTVRAELARPVALGRAAVTPYGFAAIGWGRLSQPTALERRLIEGWSLGGGLRADLPAGLSAHAELSHGGSNIFARNSTRLIGGISFRF